MLHGLSRYTGKAIGKLHRKPWHAEDKALMASWRAHGIDVILAEYGTTAADYLDVIKASGLPLVVHFHGFDASMHQTLADYGHRYRAMFDYASCVVVVSMVMYRAMLDLGCPPEKLVRNTYGPHPNFFELTPSYDSRQFVAVGRFTDKKAPHHTIDAFRQVLAQHSDARLVMAGDGALLERCKAMVNDYGIAASVEFPGIITPQQFIARLQDSLAFVQHSVTADNGDMEGTPLTVLESSAAGLPVVSTRHAGIPDVIMHAHTGFLVEEHDVDGMARYMSRLLAEPGLAAQLGRKGRKNIAEHFSLERHINILDDLLRASAGQRVRAA